MPVPALRKNALKVGVKKRAGYFAGSGETRLSHLPGRLVEVGASATRYCPRADDAVARRIPFGVGPSACYTVTAGAGRSLIFLTRYLLPPTARTARASSADGFAAFPFRHDKMRPSCLTPVAERVNHQRVVRHSNCQARKRIPHRAEQLAAKVSGGTPPRWLGLATLAKASLR